MKKIRLDVLMVNLGLAESRSKAQRLVIAGQVRVDGELIVKPSVIVSPQGKVSLAAPLEFVSRGGHKLKAALQAFDIQVTGLVCADVGASTGGFTDCLLQNGALKVFAIDVGYGILHWKLRNDNRIVVMERTNARHLHSLPELIQFATVDASFISLDYLLPEIKKWFQEQPGRVVALIKPQFEAGRDQARVGSGVIRNHEVHIEVLNKVLNESERLGFQINGLIPSPIKGPKGNVEFLVDLILNKTSLINLDKDELIASALARIPE